VKSVALVLRDHRDDLWQRWSAALRDVVAEDYQELIVSQVGERMIRSLANDFVDCSEAEPYELPGLVRHAEERVAGEAASRVELGFELLDMVRALEVLRGVILDVLVDALVTDEMPSFADTLRQLKGVDALLDRVIRAIFAVA
jgi:hypothetical protein